AFRPPDTLLEPEDGGLYLRPAQQDSHRQSGKDDGDVPGGDQIRPPTGHESRHDPFRRHQAPGARYRRRGGAAGEYALRRPPLARRYADELQDRQGVDQAPEGSRDDGAGWDVRKDEQARGADLAARDGKAQPQRRRDRKDPRPLFDRSRRLLRQPVGMKKRNASLGT